MIISTSRYTAANLNCVSSILKTIVLFMGKPITGCIYARYSRLLSGQGLENQLLPLRTLAVQRGLEIVEEYTDEGVSGSREKRPGLDRMVRDAYLGRFQFILIAALDRLGRDTRHLLNLLHELDKIGVSVISQREQIDFGTPLGKATMIILSAISQMELEACKERIRIALATKKIIAQQQGTGWRCGRPNATDEKLREKIISLYKAGLSIRAIQRQLEKRIGHSTVARIIKEFRERHS